MRRIHICFERIFTTSTDLVLCRPRIFDGLTRHDCLLRTAVKPALDTPAHSAAYARVLKIHQHRIDFFTVSRQQMAIIFNASLTIFKSEKPMNKRLLLTSIVMLATLLFTGCASSPYTGDGKIGSDAILKQQFELADKQRADKPEGRLILAAFAMHSQSKAFRNDVITAEKSVLLLDPNAIIFKLNNPAFGQNADWPYATTENIAQVLKKTSAMARPQDKIVVLMSTHGNVDVLSVNFGAKDYPHVNAKVLSQWLMDLRGKPTLVILSACYSGSFLQALSGPSRVILTAAAKDRSSFGCQFHSSNTYFVDALLNQPSLPDTTIEQLMAQAQVAIDKKERAQNLSPPSSPQISIGSLAMTWANETLKNWVRAK